MQTRELTLEEFRKSLVPAFRSVFVDTDPFGAPFRDTVAERLILYPVSYLLDGAQIDAVATAAAATGDDGFYVVETETHWPELLEDPPKPEEPRLSAELLEWAPPKIARLTWASLNRGAWKWSYEKAPAWQFALNDLQPWKEVSDYPGSTLETALVSAAGRWGMLISHESHAVVGGERTFVEMLIDRFPPAAGMASLWSADVDPDDEPLVAPGDQVSSFLRDVTNWQEPMRWLPSHLAHVYGQDRARQLLEQFGFTG